jgi:hypothetical protein
MACAERTVDMATYTTEDGRCPRCERLCDEFWVYACTTPGCGLEGVCCLGCATPIERVMLDTRVPGDAPQEGSTDE